MGPLLSFDKSFLEMLSIEEVDELDLQFKIFVTPILVSEILADLKHPEPREGRIPSDLVRALARKMVGNQGMMQMHFRALGLGEIAQELRDPVSMTGQVILDSTAPNVMRSKDGLGTIYDSRLDREMWSAWADGRFSELDEALATRWRTQSSQIDIVGIASMWQEFCDKQLQGVRSIADVIARIDALIARPAEQQNFLWMIYHFLEAPPVACTLSTRLMQAGLLPNVKAWAPYGASIARMGMVFCSCLTLKFITSRPTNVLDLQYLFYAPFGMVFVSQDKLHKQMWPATTTQATFAWGSEMKEDLRRYVAARKVTTAARERGESPISYTKQFTSENSIIARLRAKYLRGADSTVCGPTGDFSLLPLEIQKQFLEAMEVIDERNDMLRSCSDGR
jgi:hypothetical protein